MNGPEDAVTADAGRGDGQDRLFGDAVKIYMELKREEIRRGVIDAMKVLDGSLKADVMALTGMTAEEIDAVGGIEE
ncbi:hypothetical protein [Nonomuraea basaltis]|uniref:hypothetical protein n=1 Tax=Nonomuraea basaltis TaxID=2495887 RepID=UPI00110C400B|nr:hypothetical protein [Nonomuraea basaltis]TMR90174.1 hypothetical protein EJK15_56705 [Nonomuraea basaltis]